MNKFVLIRQAKYEGYTIEDDYYCLLAKAMVTNGLFAEAEVWIEDARFEDKIILSDGNYRVRLFKSFKNINEPSPDVLFVRDGLRPYIPVLDRYKDSLRIYWRAGFDNAPHWYPDFDIVLYADDKQVDEILSLNPNYLTAPMYKSASTDVYKPLSEKKLYDLCYVANVNRPVKNHYMLLDALDRVDRKISCVFVGDTSAHENHGTYASDVMNRAAESKHDIVFLGKISKNDTNTTMNQSKFGVICSEKEDSPRVIAEYLAAGIPVLCNSNLMDCDFYINDETGISRSPDDFSDGIDHMLDNYKTYSPHNYFMNNLTIDIISRYIYNLCKAHRRTQ